MTDAEITVEICGMQVTDLPDVLRIENLCYDFPWSEQLIRDCLKVGYHSLVLREEGEIRAYAFASGAAGESHILNICVDPDHRGQGYAKDLLRYCIATVMINGAKVMFLEVRESNHGAIALYESMGFVEISRRDNYYRCKSDRGKSDCKPATGKKQKKSNSGAREDALLMSRDLSLIKDENDL